MKKKLLILTILVLTLVCMLAVVAGAEEKPAIDVPAFDRTYNVGGVEYALWEKDENDVYHPLMWYLNGNGEMCKVRADNTDSTVLPYIKYTSYTDASTKELKGFTITDANGSYNSVASVAIANLHKIYLRAGDTSQITHISKAAFRGSTVLKAVFIPASLTFMGWGSSNGNFVSFESCTALEYVEIPSNAKIETICSNTFNGCTSLKAISIPDNVKTINHTSFTGCTSLKAIYMSKSIQAINGHSTWSLGAFYNCAQAYFVSEPFVLNSTCSNMPEKPDIYFFPESLETFHSITLRDCKSMNKTVVFGKKVTSMNGHQFTNYTTTEDKNVIYLGNMTDFSITENMTQSGYIHFYFPNTTDRSALKCGGSRSYNAYYYFCKDGEESVGDPHWGNVTWKTIDEAKTASWKNVKDTTHIIDPNNSTVITEPNCVVKKVTQANCFCGDGMGTVTGEVDPSNHNFDLEKGATTKDIVYVAYDKEGTRHILCGNGCGNVDTTSTVKALFEAVGYSYKEDGKGGLCGGFSINFDEYEEYTEFYPTKPISLSVLIVNPKKLTGDAFFKADGSVNATSGAIQIEVKDTKYKDIDIKVGGFTLESMEKVELAFALVVNDGEAIQVVQKQYSSTSTIISGTYTDNSGIELNAITVKSVAPEFVEALKKEQEIA